MLYVSNYSESSISIKPNHIFHKNHYETINAKKKLHNRFEFDCNKTKGKLSNESAKKLKNAVNWLCQSAPYKEVYSEKEKKKFYFKVNFITLDLPSIQHNITDEQFKNVLLHKFFNAAKYKFGLRNYVWKVETQSNSNIHAHITSDTFFHHLELRNCWNKILKSTGIIDEYQSKFKCLDFDTYKCLFDGNANYDDDKIKAAFEYGKKTNWTSPNTTDVHAVKKVKNLAGYLCEYMGKSKNRGKKIVEETKEVVNITYEKYKQFKDGSRQFQDRVYKSIQGQIRSCRRKIKGRLWGCNYALSKANNVKLEVQNENPYENIEPNSESRFDTKDIFVKRKNSTEELYAGTMILYNDKNYKALKKHIRDKIVETRESIRHNSRVTGRIIYRYD